MEAIFKKIKRFKNQDFQEGEYFEFTLNPKEVKPRKLYKIKVKKYMTEPSTPTFDFQDKWNNGNPMPLCIMKGEIIKETRGMYYMNLHGEAEKTSRCIVCGKTLKNPISKLYGIGPECSENIGLIRIESEEEAKEKLNHIVKQIEDITWEGWVIKSAILSKEEC